MSAKKKHGKKTIAKGKATKKKVATGIAKKKVAKKKVATGIAKKKVAKKKVATGIAKKKVAKKKVATGIAKKKVAKKKEMKKTIERKVEKIDKKEGQDVEYMSPAQLEYFKQILIKWKNELIKEARRTVSHLKNDATNPADPLDRATQEEEFELELHTRDRERKLLKKINAALLRIEQGTYGYCEETGEPIGFRRLEARPIATLCLEAQQHREIAKRQYRDIEDYD